MFLGNPCEDSFDLQRGHNSQTEKCYFKGNNKEIQKTLLLIHRTQESRKKAEIFISPHRTL